MVKKELAGTISGLAKYFEEQEGLKISESTIRNRLKLASIVGETAKDHRGQLRRKAFFFVSDVRQVCEDILKHLPQANEDGVIEKDGEIYGTISSLSRVLNISENAIQARISKASIDSIRGKDNKGAPNDFYPLSKVQELCADLLEDLTQANEDGVIEKDGEIYRTLMGLAKTLDLSVDSIKLKIDRSSVRPLQGKDNGGRRFNYYPLTKVQALCADLLEDLTQANEDGVIEKDGEIYGTPYSLSRILSVTGPTIRKRIAKASIDSIRGKDNKGAPNDFYPLSKVQELCADLLEDLTQANEDGVIEKDGETYRTIDGLAKSLGVDYSTVKSRVSPDNAIRGKIAGQIQTFYPESETIKQFPKNLPQANEDGVIEKDGERYRTIGGLAKSLGVVNATVKSRVSPDNAIRGKMSGGQIQTFYPESETIKQFPKNLPQANENGIIEKDGETYGTAMVLARRLGVSTPTIRARITEDTSSIQGKDTTGNTRTFYLETAIKSLCDNLIRKRNSPTRSK